MITTVFATIVAESRVPDRRSGPIYYTEKQVCIYSNGIHVCILENKCVYSGVGSNFSMGGGGLVF